MKVAVLTHSFGLPTETFIYNEISELKLISDLNVISCHRENQERFPFDRVEQIPFTQNRIRAKINWELRKRDWAFNYYSPSYSSVLRSRLKELKPDLIHAHFGPEAIRFWDNLKPKDSIPFIISLHGYDASRMLRSKAYVSKLQSICSQANVSLICVSDFMKRQLAAVGIVSPRTHILYYGTDCAFFQREDAVENPVTFTFLQISSFREKKGHKYTVEAYARFKQENPALQTQLILCGDGPLREEIQKQVSDLGLSAEIQFPGLLTPTEAKGYLQKADCFVHHSVRGENGDQEGIPNAIMEAMAMELPILSTQHAGIPELVEEAEHGYLIQEKDVPDYASKMKAIMQWPHLPKNREKVLTLFERKQHAKSLLSIYHQSIAAI